MLNNSFIQYEKNGLLISFVNMTTDGQRNAIKKIPLTEFYNNQLDSAALLLFEFDMFFEFQVADLIWSVNDDENKESKFDGVLMSRWQRASDTGVCRYQLTNLKTKILPGKYGFVAQVSIYNNL